LSHLNLTDANINPEANANLDAATGADGHT
jgi:hypothetical protein